MVKTAYALLILLAVGFLGSLVAPELVDAGFVGPTASFAGGGWVTSVAMNSEQVQAEERANNAVLIELQDRLLKPPQPDEFTNQPGDARLNAVLHVWQRSATNRQLLARFVAAETKVGRAITNAQAARDLAEELASIRGATADGGLPHRADLSDRLRQLEGQVETYLKNAPLIARVDQVLQLAIESAERRALDELEQLEPQFNDAVAALGESKHLVSTQAKTAESLWGRIGFGRRADRFLKLTVELAQKGADAKPEIDKLAKDIARFLADSQGKVQAKDAELHARLTARLKALQTQPSEPQDGRLLVLLVATKDLAEMQSELLPVLRSVLAQSPKRLVADAIFLVSKTRPTAWKGEGTDFPYTSPEAFGEDDALPGVFAACAALSDDVVVRAKCVPRKTVVLWPYRVSPRLLPQADGRHAPFPWPDVQVAWIGTEEGRSPILQSWAGAGEVQTFGSGMSQQLADWLRFQITGSAK